MRAKITPFLWFKSEAEDATRFYVSVFKDAEILSINRMGDDGPVFTTSFRIENETFIALNGGPEGDQSRFNDSISFMINCADQAEVDHFWDTLTADGGKPIGCGWLKDKFGVTWQVTPQALDDVLAGPDRAGAERAMQAMSKMVKIDIAALRAAYAGTASAA